jgi:cobyrinic acid a,c-diamide synthase
MKGVLISGTKSGCGKTTVTCAILTALKARGLALTAFKCGPDYIDPMFHRSVLGISSYNLDPFFMDDEHLQHHFAVHNTGDIAIIEGAMAYYDGIAFSDRASSYQVARAIKTPVILVLDAKSVGNSLGAELEGFIRYRADSNIKGVIFNGASKAYYEGIKSITDDSGIISFGYVPKNDDYSITSRHLGLVSAGEIPQLQQKLELLGKVAEETIDLDGLLGLAGNSFNHKAITDDAVRHDVRVGVARDASFCFIYRENLDLLRSLGCELVFFSPLNDNHLPQQLHGLYLAGGYPEIFVQKLSNNKTMRDEIRATINSGMPTIAECGGFLYLHKTLDNFPMVDVINGEAHGTKKLQRFGYITLRAEKDNMLCREGEEIRSHEFHYWESGVAGNDWLAFKAGNENKYLCAYATENLYAGFPHIYFPANPSFAYNFVKKIKEYAGIK